MPSISQKQTPVLVSQNGPKFREGPAKTGSVLDRIQPLSIDSQDGLKLLLYGDSGTGKTTFWATFPGPILAILCSGGLRPGELRSVNTEEYRKKIKSVVLNEGQELKTIIEHLRHKDRTADGYQTVVLDHVSGLQDLLLKEILGLQEIPAKKVWGLADQQEYGQVAQQCTTYLRDLLGLKMNVVIIGQERIFKGKDDGIRSEIVKPAIGVGVIPSLANWLNPACDYILQTFKRPVMVTTYQVVSNQKIPIQERGKGVEYCIRCEPHDVYTTKFRVPKGHALTLPDVIVDPSYDKLVKIIKGEK